MKGAVLDGGKSGSADGLAAGPRARLLHRFGSEAAAYA